jgi:hypothetical protein
MSPSFAAFAGELLLIKQAEVDQGPEAQNLTAEAAPVQDEEKPFKSQFPTLARERLKSSLKYGLGHGLGMGAAYLVGDKLLPKILPSRWSDVTRRNVGLTIGGLGAVGSMALWDATRQAARKEEDALKRNS